MIRLWELITPGLNSTSNRMATYSRRSWSVRPSIIIASVTLLAIGIYFVHEIRDQNRDAFGTVVSTGNWTRVFDAGMKAGTVESKSSATFTLVTVSSIDNHLLGNFVFLFQSPPAILFEGTETKDHEFWPFATAQVTNEPGRWKSIGRPLTQGNFATVTIQPQDTKTSLHINLDIFRPMIGRVKYGRVVLDNGAAVDFELKDLLPPKEGDAKGSELSIDTNQVVRHSLSRWCDPCELNIRARFIIC